MTTQFKREERYYVLKISDMKKYLSAEKQEAVRATAEKLNAGRAVEGKPVLQAVVIESDWPEYERVWQMIETRMITTRSQFLNGNNDRRFWTIPVLEQDESVALSEAGQRIMNLARRWYLSNTTAECDEASNALHQAVRAYTKPQQCKPLTLTEINSWFDRRLKAAGPNGITDIRAFAEECVRIGEQKLDLSKLKPENQKQMQEWINDGSFAQRAIDSMPQFKEFIEWAGSQGYDCAQTCNSDTGEWIALNPMTADLWKAWQAAHSIKE